MIIRDATTQDRDWALEESGPVGGRQVVSRGVLHTLGDYPICVAVEGRVRLGFVVLRPEQTSVEILAIRAVSQWRGVGTALMAHAEAYARARDINSVWLVTTNDNLPALQFYQRLGYALVDLRPGAFAEVRRLKGLDPALEILGHHDIPIRDELKLAKVLDKPDA